MKTLLKIFFAVMMIFSGINVNAQTDWSILGNTATDPAVNFIGTTDNKVFKIKTNNQIRIQITGSGNVKIGSGAAATKLDVAGTITATGGNSDNWNSAFGWGNHAAAGYLTSYTETDPQVGTVTTSFVPRWNGSALTTGSIYDNAIGVGIGTTSIADCKFGVQQSSASLATAKFSNASKGPNISWIHFAGAGDWHIRSAANAGKVILQDQDDSSLVSIGTPGGSSKLNVVQTGTTVSTAEFTNSTKGPNTSNIHYGINGDWYIRSAASAGNVVLQDQPAATVCIGTSTPATGFKLSVFGKIMAEEVRVKLHANWPDYVFDDNYDLMPVEELKNHLVVNKHLPGLPSAAQIKEQGGTDLGEMQRKLLEKVEELTLYIIKQQEEINTLKKKVDNR